MKSRAIILSGGKGSRLGGNIPKQYLEIREKPILSYTLRAFQKSNIDEILIVASPQYCSLCEKIARFFHCDKLQAVVPGGKERYDSVLAGLHYFQNEQGAEDLVLIHDGARPFISVDSINQILEECKRYGAVIAATPCTDTIKLVDEEGNITGTTTRRLTWAAQTPQAFPQKDLLAAYEQVLKDPAGLEITDDAMVYQQAFPERKIKVFPAGHENIKITTQQDLLHAESYLGEVDSTKYQ